MTKAPALLVFVMSVLTGPVLALSNDDFCPILWSYTPPNTEGCLANAAPDPSDGSFVYLTRNGSDIRALLLRDDLGAGGDCRPTSDSIFTGSLCITFDYEVAPDYDAICTYPSVPTACSNTAYESIRVDGTNLTISESQVGGFNEAPSERFFEAARGLQFGDVAAQKIGTVVVYKGPADATGRYLRLSRGADASPSIRVRILVDDRGELAAALDEIDAAGVPLANVVAIGLEGRFIAHVGGTITFYGTDADCGGECTAREMLDDAAFASRLSEWSTQVQIETPTANLRDLLIDRLLLGRLTHPPVDDPLEAARVRQPPALLLLKWD